MSTGLLLAAAVLALVGAAGLRRAVQAPAAPAASRPAAARTDSVPTVAPADLRAWLAAHPGAVLLDVRTPAEFEDGHLEGAVNLDVQAPDFGERAAALARATPYVVYCRSGARAARAGGRLVALGHAPVVNAGGFEALVRASLPGAR